MSAQIMDELHANYMQIKRGYKCLFVTS